MLCLHCLRPSDLGSPRMLPKPVQKLEVELGAFQRDLLWADHSAVGLESTLPGQPEPVTDEASGAEKGAAVVGNVGRRPRKGGGQVNTE